MNALALGRDFARLASLPILIAVVGAACDATVNNCPIEASQNLREAGITTDLRRPYRCEYTIHVALEYVEYESMFYAPDLTFAGKTAWTEIRNLDGAQVGPLNYSTVFQQGAACGFNRSCAFSMLSFQAGTTPYDAPAPFGHKFREQAWITVEMPDGFLGNAQLTLNGTLGALANIIGPSSVQAPYSDSWAADVTADTLSFQYRWYVNGNLIQGATNRTLTYFPYGESGNYGLTSIVELMDQTTDTVTTTVAVEMSAGWDGPSEVEAGALGTWQAVGYAARYPLTCQWVINYTSFSGCTLNYTFSSPGYYDLLLSTTDARGVSASNGPYGIYVRTPGCYPPDCYEQYRVPESRRRPASEGSTRLPFPPAAKRP